MPFFDHINATTEEFLPLLSTMAIIFFIVAIIRFVLKKRWQDKTDMQFHYQLSMLAIGFTVFLVFILTLPISETLRGQLLGLIGILLSAAIALSSTTFIGNILAGIMLKVIGNIRMGSFLTVQDIMGRVSEMGLLHIEVQTEDRDLITIPNLLAATQSVKVVRSSGTIVSAEVSLGYDIVRTRVTTLLTTAANNAGLEECFVHIRSLGDFAITYRTAGLLKDTNNLLSARSELRKSMIDCLHEAGIEIVSPNFMNTRSLNPKQQFIPKKLLETENKEDTSPEEIIFDKADAAASIDSIENIIRSIEDKLTRHKEGHLTLSDIALTNEKRKKENLLDALKIAKEQYKLNDEDN